MEGKPALGRVTEWWARSQGVVSVVHQHSQSKLGCRCAPTVTLLFQDVGIAGKAVDAPAFRLILPVPELTVAFEGLLVAVPEMIALPPEPHVPADGRQTAQKAH